MSRDSQARNAKSREGQRGSLVDLEAVSRCLRISLPTLRRTSPSRLFSWSLLLTYGVTLTILSPRLFSAVIWIEWFFRNSSASSRAATVSK